MEIKDDFVVLFLDDGACSAQTFDLACLHSKIIKNDLISAGWVPNKSKCVWLPSQSISWLGFLYNFILGIIMADDEKLRSTIQVIDLVLSVSVLSVRLLAKVVGKIISLELSHGDIVYLQTRHLQRIIASANHWDDNVVLNVMSIAELNFWKNYLFTGNGSSFDYSCFSNSICTSYASATGCATVYTQFPHCQDLVSHRMFSPEEVSASSTTRELLAVIHGIESFSDFITHSILHWFTDNTSVVRIVRRGSMKPHLHKLAKQIYQLTRVFDIKLLVSWIPREENQRADFYSKVIDFDDWFVSDFRFNFICERLVFQTLIVLQILIMLDVLYLIQGITVLAQMGLMHLLRTGLCILTGLFLLYI